MLTSRLTGLGKSGLQIKIKIVRCHIADSKPVKQEVNGTVILPPLVFPGDLLAMPFGYRAPRFSSYHCRGSSREPRH
jgi:hypothetical protein